MNNIKMKIPEFIARRLHDEGVKYVFGVPGGASIPYIEAFRNAGIEFILTSNEASAGIMADVSARITGIPGVCHATFGPGATNLSTGVGYAFLDRSPVLALTNEYSDEMLHRTAQMNIDHQKLFSPLTKATFRLTSQNTSDTFERALRICREEYPGPVHIGIPDNISDCEINVEPVIQASPEKFADNDLSEIISLLQQARRPLIAVGLTARRLGLSDKILGFLQSHRIPVVITPMAKGIIPEKHPSYCGVLFHALSNYLDDIIEKCDIIIGIGYDQTEYNYESWVTGVPLIHFDVRETDLPEGKNIFRFTGDPGEWFSILNNLNLGSLVFESAVVEGIRNEMESVFNGFSSHFGPVGAMKALQEELPAKSIITADVGSHLHLAGQFWECGDKGDFIISNGWSGMGFGIPAALAARLHCPRVPVFCITGDGGFLMMAGEIVTARRYNLPVTIVVFSDGELNLIKLKQSWKGVPAYGTVMYSGDLFGSDLFLGVKVLKADTTDKMKNCVNTALSLNEPVIINAIIDPEDYRWLVVER